MPNVNNLPLTSAEIANLWNLYMADSLFVCVTKYFVAKAEDKEIRAISQQAQIISEQRTRSIATIFNSNNLPVPIGYTDKDVNLAAPRLFSDSLALAHTLYRSRWTLTTSATALYLAARSDVRKLFQDALSASAQLNEQTTHVALEKGLYIRAPIVSVPPTPHIVEKPSYLGGLIGENRPLHVISVANMSLSILENILGKVLITGFCQVTQNPEVKKLFLRGQEIAGKHTEVLSALLSREDVPIPASPDSMLTVSTIAPFSEKLMLNHIIMINTVSTADMGLAASQSIRTDIAAAYLRFGAEVMQFSEDAIQVAIKNDWLEAPPQIVSHRDLAMSGR